MYILKYMFFQAKNLNDIFFQDQNYSQYRGFKNHQKAEKTDCTQLRATTGSTGVLQKI